MREPSFPAAIHRDRGSSRAAFIFAGQPRTLTHPAAHRSLLHHAISGFGLDADVFFYLTNDDLGNTYGQKATREDAAAVREAMNFFRPKDAYYGPFTNSSYPAPPRDCVLNRFVTRAYYKYDRKSPLRWQVFWAT